MAPTWQNPKFPANTAADNARPVGFVRLITGSGYTKREEADVISARIDEMSSAAAIMSGMNGDQLPECGRLVGIMTTAELHASGLTKTRIQTLVSRGLLRPVGRGLYARGERVRALAAFPDGERTIRVAAALVRVGPGTVVSHHDAALIHGIDLLEQAPAAISLTRPPDSAGSRTGRPGVDLHVASIPTSHAMILHRLPITTAARTVVDLARIGLVRSGVVSADSALHKLLTTKAELLAVIDAMPRWPGIERARQVVDFADALAESPFESIARCAFSDWGLPAPDLQVPIAGNGRLIGRVDFLWPAYATIAETDGALKYEDPARAVQQLERDARLRAAGYEVVHITWRDLHREADMVRQRILAAFRRQAVLGRAVRAT